MLRESSHKSTQTGFENLKKNIRKWNGDVWKPKAWCYLHKPPAHLCDEELGEPLGESAFFTGEDHLQHVAMELLHHNEHFLRGLKHALQVHDA